LKSKQESKKGIFLTKILEGCQIQGKKEKQKFIQHSSEGNCTCFERQEKQIKLYPWKRLASIPPFSAAISSRKQQRIKLLSLHRSLVLLCSLQGEIVLDQRFKPLSVKSKHSRVFICVIRVRLKVCLHYYRQQFPFTLRIVSTKRHLFYCVFARCIRGGDETSR